MAHGKVAVAVCCMDYRLHKPEVSLASQLEDVLGADAVYIYTCAGPEGKVIAGEDGFRDMVKDLQLIIDAKGASTIAICGHHDCAGHPVSDEDHELDSVRSAAVLSEHLEFSGDVIPLIARKSGEGASVYEWHILRI